MVKTSIITVAGISSRFNKGMLEPEKRLKAIYTERDEKNTLLYQLIKKMSFSDRIIIVGGYKYNDLKQYCDGLAPPLRNKLSLIFNAHYEVLSTGYSLYLGLKEALSCGTDEIIFAEGDLDIDSESFLKVVEAKRSVLTYTFEPIYANKAVVFYKDDKNRYRYAYNSQHGLLSIDCPFSCIFNSGQIWKLTEMEALQQSCERFYNEAKEDTNLRIIQSYLDCGIDVDLVALKYWTNCNTKDDYKKIVSRWEEQL